MPHRTFSLFAIALLWLTSSVGYGQALKWKNLLERDNPDLHVFNTEGSTLFANGGEQGIYRSTDNGYSWEICPSSILGGYVVRYDSTNLFAHNSKLLSRSTDNGKTWKTESFEHRIRSMTVLRAIIFIAAGTDTSIYLLRSQDTGKTWERLPFLFTENVVITKIDTSLIGFGETQKQYRSDDQGRTWQKTFSVINIPHLYAASKKAILHKPLNPSYPREPYAPTDSVFTFYRTRDGGRTWDTLRYTSYFFYFLTADQQRFYAIGKRENKRSVRDSIFVSDDEGNTWRSLAILPYYILGNGISAYNPAPVSFIVRDNSFIISINKNRIFRSIDSGQTWQMAHSRYIDYDAKKALSVNGTMYIATRLGIFRSVNQGQTWKLLRNRIRGSYIWGDIYNNKPSPKTVDEFIERVVDSQDIESSVVVDSSGGLWALTYDNLLLIQSLDKGQTWSLVKSWDYRIYDMVHHNKRLFTSFVQRDEAGILVSDTNKSTWNKIPKLPYHTYKLASNNSVLIAFTDSGHVFRSFTDGEQWESRPIFKDAYIIYNIIFTANGGILAATSKGLFRSDSNGDYWREIQINDLLQPQISNIAIQGNTLMALAIDKGIFISRNSGRTWQKQQDDNVLPDFISKENYNLSWRQRLNTTPLILLDSLAIIIKGSDSYDCNVFTAQLPPTQLDTTIKTTNLIQVFPHPISRQTTISYTVQQDTDLHVSAYNIIGMKVADIANVSVTKGEYFFDWDTGYMPSGVYIIRCITNNNVEAKTVQIIR
jgi:photosystem II stability/assembly factor-like uncharacterized protein